MMFEYKITYKLPESMVMTGHPLIEYAVGINIDEALKAFRLAHPQEYYWVLSVEFHDDDIPEAHRFTCWNKSYRERAK